MHEFSCTAQLNADEFAPSMCGHNQLVCEINQL